MTHLSCHCKQNTKLIKLDFHHLRAQEICDPCRWVSFHTPTWRRKTGSSRVFNVFAWEQKQRSPSRFWRRRMRQMTKSSSPRKWVFETINWRCSPNFHKDDTFLLFAGSTTAYQNARQCSTGEMSHSCFFTENHAEHESCGLCPFFFSARTWLPYASRGAPFVFQATTERRALKLSKIKKNIRRKGWFYLGCALLEDNAYMC